MFPRADLSRAHEPLHDDAVNRDEREGDSAYAAELAPLRAHLTELQEDKRQLSAEIDRAAGERAQLLTMLARKDEVLQEKDRMLAAQADQVRLLTDERKRTKKSWWIKWW